MSKPEQTSPRKKKPAVVEKESRAAAKPETTPAPEPSETFAPPAAPSEILSIAIDCLSPNPNQPRQHFDEKMIEGLAESIRELGFINPITVQKGLDDKFIIIAGEQRWKAAQKVPGITHVPCVVKDGQQADELALAENTMRQDLTAIEEAEALAKLVERGTAQKDLAKKFGKSEGTISDYLAISRLSKSIKDECRGDPDYSRRELRKIAQARPEQQEAMFNKYKKKVKSTVRAPNEKVRPASANLTTAIKSLSKSLDTINRVEGAAEQEKIRAELRRLLQKISDLLA